jgi:hypothetical protein
MTDCRTALRLFLFAFAVQLAGCGSDGGAPENTGNPPVARDAGTTRFVGTTSASLAGTTVCVEGTPFCTNVRADGTFTLDANVGGDLVLVFQGSDFIARLNLADLPAGATVRIDEIVCNPATGRCSAGDVVIVGDDNLPPRCDLAFASPSILWPPNHDLVRIDIEGVVDPDGDPILIVILDVMQDEPVGLDDEGSGNTAPDARVSPLGVRAERSGRSNGRVYTIVFEAQDDDGARCSEVVQVCVPHDQGNGNACIDDGAAFDSFGS